MSTIPKRRSPQEKKLLSYKKDRRNAYGENDKSSRKNIRRNKKAPHRANRRQVTQTLEGAVGTVDPDREQALADRLDIKRPKRWKKWRDESLGVIVQWRLENRAGRNADVVAKNDLRLQRIRRRLRLPG